MYTAIALLAAEFLFFAIAYVALTKVSSLKKPKSQQRMIVLLIFIVCLLVHFSTQIFTTMQLTADSASDLLNYMFSQQLGQTATTVFIVALFCILPYKWLN